MNTMSGMTVGVFRSMAAAEEAVSTLERLGIARERITVLTPGSSACIDRVPTSDTEQEGMGPALAGAISGGLGLGLGVALLIPGVGPITVLGALAAGLMGAGGAAAGAAVAATLEAHSLSGLLPADELYVYEDALSKGRTVVIVSAEDRSAEVSNALEAGGAETIDRAREDWWVGIRDAEKLEYSGPEAMPEPGSKDEGVFRQGFEAAARLRSRGKSDEAIEDMIRDEYPELCNEHLFVRGYKRGIAEGRRRKQGRAGPASGEPPRS
jgi:hypothetical protein